MGYSAYGGGSKGGPPDFVEVFCVALSLERMGLSMGAYSGAKRYALIIADAVGVGNLGVGPMI